VNHYLLLKSQSTTKQLASLLLLLHWMSEEENLIQFSDHFHLSFESNFAIFTCTVFQLDPIFELVNYRRAMFVNLYDFEVVSSVYYKEKKRDSQERFSNLIPS
jgi:myosin-crossreactive antigen